MKSDHTYSCDKIKLSLTKYYARNKKFARTLLSNLKRTSYVNLCNKTIRSSFINNKKIRSS